MKKITLMTSKVCGPCFALKNKLLAEKIEVTTLDYSDPLNIPFFREHGVRTVPILLVEDGAIVTKISGIQEILDYLKNNKN